MTKRKQNIGKIINQEVIKQKISVRELCRRAKIRPNSYYSIINSDANYSIETLIFVLNVLNIKKFYI